MSTVSVDPGKRHIALAVWHDGMLVLAGVAKGPIVNGGDDVDVVAQTALAGAAYLREHPVTVGRLSELWCERPQVYTSSKQVKDGHRTDPNDLPPLFGCDVGLAVALGLRVRSVLPRSWKGTLTKAQGNARAYDALSITERVCIDPHTPADKMHDVLDAIGIGLHFLGRFGRNRQYPRS